MLSTSRRRMNAATLPVATICMPLPQCVYAFTATVDCCRHVSAGYASRAPRQAHHGTAPFATRARLACSASPRRHAVALPRHAAPARFSAIAVATPVVTAAMRAPPPPANNSQAMLSPSLYRCRTLLMVLPAARFDVAVNSCHDVGTPYILKVWNSSGSHTPSFSPPPLARLPAAGYAVLACGG